MTGFEIKFREEHKTDIGEYEKMYLDQGGCCAGCQKWNPIHWLRRIDPPVPGLTPKLVCISCSSKTRRIKLGVKIWEQKGEVA